MIRPIDIKLNAAHPELPLCEATTFTGAPSSVFIRGVPKSVGNWSIAAVNVAVTYPDNSTTTRAAVESAEGVWVATIPGTATSGRTVAGFRILADGIDENGAAVTGYVLGFADFAVLSFFPVPAPGETFFYLRYFDTMPTAAKKMDVTTIDGILKYYNGTAWLPFTDLSNYYTKAETDNAIERVAAYYITYNAAGAAFPTRADLINAQTYYSGGVARVPTRNDYAVVLADETHDGAEWRYIYAVADGQTTGQWEAQYPVEGVIAYDNTVTRTSENGVKSSGIWSALWGALAALPTGFTSLYDWCVSQLAGKANDNAVVKLTGDQTIGGTKKFTSYPVAAPEAPIVHSWFESNEYGDLVLVNEAGEAGRIVVPRLNGTMALLQNLAPDYDGTSSHTYAVDDLRVYYRFLFRCTTAHTATSWDDTKWTPATVEDVLAALRAAIAGKADVSALSYALGAVITSSAQLSDRTANYIAPTSGTASIALTFPTSEGGKARDFYALVAPGASFGGSISFTAPTGSTIYGDGFGATVAPGEAWLFSITEIANNQFYTRTIKMEVPA